MVHHTLTTALLAGALALAVSCGAMANGASASMLSDTCSGCHGTDGASLGPASPTIAGISEAYFEEIMKGFADGSVPSTIMGRIAKGYTDDELKTMAKHFAGLKFAAAQQKHDASLATQGAKLHDKYCEKCHANGGTSAEDDAGILKGQWSPYVRWSMEDFQSGKREPPKKMKTQLEKLIQKEGDKGINALLNFYASGK